MIQQTKTSHKTFVAVLYGLAGWTLASHFSILLAEYDKKDQNTELENRFIHTTEYEYRTLSVRIPFRSKIQEKT